MNRVQFFLLVFVFLVSHCTFIKEESLFKFLPSSHTGLDFKNLLTISDSINGITFEYIYNGGGVAVADLNNDGLKDVFFSGNMVSSKMYLNQGGLIFKDVTESSGLSTDRWCTGVAITDINDDGLKDIYISIAGFEPGKSRENIFYINQGIDDDGIPHFRDMAKEYGLNDNGYSTMGVFFDFDKDKDLDLFLLTNAEDGSKRNALKKIRINGEAESTDRLYRNEGDGTFTNISKESGILKEGYGLGVAICDINQDGWLDIYCADDFISNDLLWINNQDGTFTESAGEYFSHFTHNGMGMDIADYNNDGLLDVIVVDMLPVSNYRQKMMIPSLNLGRFYGGLQLGYHPQFMRNTLQLNQGKFKDGKYRFSEIGFLAGMFQTDWSWAPLFADFDNDGWKDLLITNGFRKDVTNLDYIKDIGKRSQFGTEESRRNFFINAMDNLPDVKLPNFIFKNEGDLTFSDKSKEWGLVHPTFTNGTAYADFDNDGDLDIILNNIDQEVTLYENRLQSSEKPSNNSNYLSIRFHEKTKEYEKTGLKVWVYQQDNKQYFEYSIYRGYKSTIDNDIHIGLGQSGQIDSLVFQWNDGTIQKIINPSVNIIMILAKVGNSHFSDSSYIYQFTDSKNEIEFENITDKLNLNYKHDDVISIDFSITKSLIHYLSKYGPSITVGDINQDGMDDFFIGADAQRSSSLFLQNANSTFSRTDIEADSSYEDLGTLLFDADNDGDLDLYVVSGGYRWPAKSKQYQDRLYMNDGKGYYIQNEEALPKIESSGSCVIASDYDLDGDLDLFIGGRVIGRNYPSTPQSYLLENKDGVFVNQSKLLGEQKGKLGMVTSALWTDVNNDKSPDLIIVGEWMPITILINKNGEFINETATYQLEETTGWWNSVNGADFDQDGDIDYILGNYGLNSFFKCSKEKPIEIYSGDFDKNGVNDPIITQYAGDESYLVHPFNVLLELIPGMKNRFSTFSEYGKTSFKDAFLKEELANSIKMDCKTMESVVLENSGKDGFIIHPLPTEVQFSPVFGTLVDDVNADHLPDLILVGNSLSEETTTGYYDASFGNVLINQGNFKWKAEPPALSNFIADGDKKSMATISVGNNKVMLISENNGTLQAMTYLQALNSKWITFQADDWYYTLKIGDKIQKVELYYGNGFNSSSTRKVSFPMDMEEIAIYKYNGSQRRVNLNY